MEYLIGFLAPCLLAGVFYFGWHLRGKQKQVTTPAIAARQPPKPVNEKEAERVRDLQEWTRETFGYNVEKALQGGERRGT